MPRLLMLAPGELTRDPRARRAAVAAAGAGFEVVGVCPARGDEPPVALEGVEIQRVGGGTVSRRLRHVGLGGMRPSSPPVRELRGAFRIARLAAATLRFGLTTRRIGRFDVVHAHDFETLPAALAARRGARLVYDAHELYADQEPDAPGIYRAFVRAVEPRLARRADAVVTVGEGIGGELRRSLGLRVDPIVVLSCPPRTSSEPAANGGGPLKAVYQGAAGPGRPLTDLLDAAERATSVRLTIRVANADLAELRRAVAARGLDGRVGVAEPVPPDGLVDALRGFAVGLVINRPLTRNDELVLPNKLFEYLMAGLAVVVPRLPGMAPLVEGEGVGLTYAPARPDSLALALERLAAEPERLAQMRARARRVALDRFNAETQAKELVAAWRGAI